MKDKRDCFLKDILGLYAHLSRVFASSLRRKGNNCANLDSSITQYKWNLRAKVLEPQADKEFSSVSLFMEMRFRCDILIVISMNEKERKDAVYDCLDWLQGFCISYIFSK